MRGRLTWLVFCVCAACTTLHGRGRSLDASSGEPRDASSPPPKDAASARDAALDGSDDDAGTQPGVPAVPSLCIGCADGDKVCEGQCVSSSDPSLGCSDLSCQPCALAHARATCSEQGSCAIASCEPGWSDCDADSANGCEAELGRPETCGGCSAEHACAGQTSLCSPTGCVESCMPPLTQCGQRCVDLATSTASCGSCEATCGAAEQAQQAFPSCSAGSCRLQCFEGLSACAGGCWDTTQSKQHCGACGHSCQDTEQCLASACVTARCPNGWTSCVGSCVTTQTDPKHCGACPVRCDTSEVCIAGHCVEAGSQWLAAGLSQPADLALDATHVYWTDRGDNTVRAVAKLGGSVRTLATEQARPLHPVVDDTHVYWSNELGGAIMRAPKDGSAVPALVAAVSEPRVIAVAGPYLYLPGSGTLDRVHKTGGVPEAFVALEEVHGPADFLEMLADGDALYVATAYGSTSRIWRVNLSTGAVATVHADDRSLIPALALDAEHVYFGSAFDPSKFIALSWVDRSSGAYAGSLRTSVDGADLFVTDFALADCGLLWTDGKRIYLSRPGYPLAAALTSGKIAGLAADETALYWTDANGFVGRLPQP